ncbi:macrophage mannose receptor 1-like [Syngnathus scovelli]|uniref:macrophage mannose receptor 1-like n=1 Tax=Syngnathus scovelli TaxID=161590 RepID=UPI00210F580D|nr:secretory phospholipase A2 receptor-like [Syngnathus scovelli]
MSALNHGTLKIKATRWLFVQALLNLVLRTTSAISSDPFEKKCDPDEVAFNHFCYYFEFDNKNLKADWEAAENYCRARNSHLLSLHSANETNFVKAHMQSNSTWLGVKKYTGREAIYSDGTWPDENPYYSLNLEKMVVPYCLGMTMPDRFHYCHCSNQYSFICKKGQTPNRNQTVWSDECGWWVNNPSNNFCYWFNNNIWTTWDEANHKCYVKNGNLLRITDLKEQTFLHDYLQEFWNGTSLWMDGKNKNGEFWWGNRLQAPSYIRWSSVRESDPPSRCLSFVVGQSVWKEENCFNFQGFICKKEKAAQD